MPPLKHPAIPLWWTYPHTYGFTLPNFRPHQEGGSKPILLGGHAPAEHILNECKVLLRGRTIPRLAVVLVGDDPASQVYVSRKMKTFSAIGFQSQLFTMSAQACTLEALLSLIETLNGDESFHGILVQLPLPKTIDTQRVLNAIRPEKDVDGFSTQNLGYLSAGYFGTTPVACTPFGIMCLLWAYGIDLEKKDVVVVGRSLIVGRPMAFLALASDATVSIAHSKTSSLEEYTKRADVLIVAAGKRDLITSRHIRPGTIVVDVGMHRAPDGTLCGDVSREAWPVAGGITPVPGGVGPMTIAMLCLNTALSAWRTEPLLPKHSL